MGNTAGSSSSPVSPPLQVSKKTPSLTEDGFRLVQIGPESDPAASKLRIFVISDTHGKHRSLDLPRDGADVLIHAGDHANWKTSARDTHDFNEWLGEITDKFPIRLVCCGNHELFVEKAGTHEARARLLSNAVYCEGETVTVGDGVTLFFAPWTPSRNFMYRANAFQRGKKQLANLLVPCPENVDVLVTHCPPLGILDVHRKGHHMGSSEILDCVQRVLPSVHLFGHCHDDGGVATGEIDTRHSAAARWRYAMQKGQASRLPPNVKTESTGDGKTDAGSSNEVPTEQLEADSSSVWICKHCSYANNPSMFLACAICNIEKPAWGNSEAGIVRHSTLYAQSYGMHAAASVSTEIRESEQQKLPSSACTALQNEVIFVNASNRLGEQPILLDVYYYPPSKRRPENESSDRPCVRESEAVA
eukprot:g1856.t1